MSEMEREKPDAAEAPTEEFDAIADELLDDGDYRIVDMRRLRWWLLAFAIVLGVFASGSAFLADVFADVVAMIVVIALLAVFFIWLAQQAVNGLAPKR